VKLTVVRMMLLACVTATAALVACGSAPAPPPPAAAAVAAEPTPAADEDHGHEHEAPHGGSLVEFGDEFAHLELVLDASTGTLTAYVLDGEAEQPVRLPVQGIDMRVTAPAGAAPVRLLPVANALSGETVGDTSMFAATVPGLKGLSSFSGAVVELSVKGQTFTNVQFEYPATDH
jgi:hypothetical protein